MPSPVVPPHAPSSYGRRIAGQAWAAISCWRGGGIVPIVPPDARPSLQGRGVAVRAWAATSSFLVPSRSRGVTARAPAETSFSVAPPRRGGVARRPWAATAASSRRDERGGDARGVARRSRRPASGSVQPKSCAESVVPPLFFACFVILTASDVGPEPPAGQNVARGSAMSVMEAFRLGAKRRAENRARNLLASHDVGLLHRDDKRNRNSGPKYYLRGYIPYHIPISPRTR